MNRDDLGDRMKGSYESRFDMRFMPLLPIIVRVDGKCFSRYTKGLHRPFDGRLVAAMQTTTKRLVEETNALVGYTQSDEITLVIYSNNHKSQVLFDGRKQKIDSVVASMATLYFDSAAREIFGDERPCVDALFDCRSFQVPNLAEAANAVLWRELDASKNSVSMLARSHFSHKSLQGMSSKQMQEKLMTEAGANWNDLPDHLKRGTYFQRRVVSKGLTTDELQRIPEQHRPPEGTLFERHVVERLELPPLPRIEDKVSALFRMEAK